MKNMFGTPGLRNRALRTRQNITVKLSKPETILLQVAVVEWYAHLAHIRASTKGPGVVHSPGVPHIFFMKKKSSGERGYIIRPHDFEENGGSCTFM